MGAGLAFIISATVATGGWLARALTVDGAIAAVLVGTAVVGTTGLPGLATLGAFFVGASLLSRLAPDPTARLDAKGPRRDACQVVANGGPAAIGGLLEYFLPGAGIWVVTASLSAAAADTWATSAGGWSRALPRLITTWTRVPAGTSGGVTGIGTAGALAGAISVSGCAALAGAPPLASGLAAAVGLAGMALDSVLGATVQGRFHCDRCDRPTEQRRHRCGTPATATGGWSWFNNDGVNLAATSAAGLSGLLLWRWLG
jgi:uncharacterized protein (TIGR00297 family)